MIYRSWGEIALKSVIAVGACLNNLLAGVGHGPNDYFLLVADKFIH